MAKYWITTVNSKHELDVTTYEHLKARTLSNRSGFYEIKSGPSIGYIIAMSHIVSLSIQRSPKELEEAMGKAFIAEDKGEHDELKKPKPPTCKINHMCYTKYTKFNADKSPNKDWPDEIDVRARTTKSGVKHYVPVCSVCGKQMPIVKPATVPRIFGYDTLEDVPPLEK